MLSILIPTYNYNILPLVNELHQQVTKLGKPFEILVFDDGSSQYHSENSQINTLQNTSYTILKENIGRSAIRNRLAQKATYNNLLFLDADVEINHEQFIEDYIEAINDSTEIIYGGIDYSKQPPADDKTLRWRYGTKREALSLEERQKNPYLRFLTLCFLVKKSVFSKISFNEDIPNLRHEDTLFAMDAKIHNINIQHIDNPVRIKV